jgi:hypothetical protein
MFEHSTSSVYDTRNTQRSKRNSYDAAQAPSHPHVMSLHNLIRGKLVNHDEKQLALFKHGTKLVLCINVGDRCSGSLISLPF